MKTLKIQRRMVRTVLSYVIYILLTMKGTEATFIGCTGRTGITSELLRNLKVQ